MRLREVPNVVRNLGGARCNWA